MKRIILILLLVLFAFCQADAQSRGSRYARKPVPGFTPLPIGTKRKPKPSPVTKQPYEIYFEMAYEDTKPNIDVTLNYDLDFIFHPKYAKKYKINKKTVEEEKALFVYLVNSTLNDPEVFRYLPARPVGKGFKPAGLIEVNKYCVEIDACKGEKILIKANVYNVFEMMYEHAKADGSVLAIDSAYRSYAAQQVLYNNLPSGVAARPGYSYHHLGTTIDFSRSEICREEYCRAPNAKNSEFAPNFNFGTHEYNWLLNNASKYGFIGNVSTEPWHFQYFGKNGLALMNKFFYGDYESMLVFLHLHKAKLPLVGLADIPAGAISLALPAELYFNKI